MDQMHPNGNATLIAGGTIAKGQAVKIANGNAVACTAATDKAVGVALDGAASAGEVVPVAIRGAFNGTCDVKLAAQTTVQPGDKLNILGAAVGAGDEVLAMVVQGGSSGETVECALAL